MGAVAEVARLVDKVDGLVRVHERSAPYLNRGASENIRPDLESEGGAALADPAGGKSTSDFKVLLSGVDTLHLSARAILDEAVMPDVEGGA